MSFQHLWSLLFGTPFVWQLGLSVLCGQCLLYVVFKYVLINGPWTTDASFSAHQVLCIPLMAYLTYHGFREWFSYTNKSSSSSSSYYNDDANEDAIDRILGPHPQPDLSLVVFTVMLFWDIPTGLLTPSLRNQPTMMAHHVAMLLTSMVALGVFSDGHPLLGYYASFYFGVIEISSVPLIFVDLFHPKHTEWYTYLTTTAPTWVQLANDVNRIVFAILFLLVRAICFPYVSVAYVLKDVWTVTTTLSKEERNGVSSTPLYCMAVLNIFFSCLQCYWGLLVLRQVLKAIMHQPSSSKKEKSA